MQKKENNEKNVVTERPHKTWPKNKASEIILHISCACFSLCSFLHIIQYGIKCYFWAWNINSVTKWTELNWAVCAQTWARSCPSTRSVRWTCRAVCKWTRRCRCARTASRRRLARPPARRAAAKKHVMSVLLQSTSHHVAPCWPRCWPASSSS